MKKIVAVTAMTLVILTTFADQGGSFFLSDLKDLLAQQKVLWNQVESTFEIDSVGDARRIGWGENHALGGTRIGPYALDAKPKGTSGPFTYEIEIETRPVFYDKSGHEVTLAKAVKVKEEFISIKIRPLKPSEYSVQRPH